MDLLATLFSKEFVRNYQRTCVLTGSRVYGAPRSDSDIDLVVLVDRGTLQIISEAANDELQRPNLESNSWVSDHGLEQCQATFKFGKLNLIVVTEQADFDIWVAGTEVLLKKKVSSGPVTRSEAIATFRAIRKQSLEKPSP